MATPCNINSSEIVETTNATPRTAGIVEIQNGCILLFDVFVMAVRSDGSTKTWQGLSLLRKIGGTLTAIETIPAGLNLFASAADETALTGVSVALFSDNTYLGVTCTGQAGQTINWSVELTGRGMRA
jgi:hypothetical protein